MSWAEVLKSLNKRTDKALNEIITEEHSQLETNILNVTKSHTQKIGSKNSGAGSVTTVLSVTGKGALLALHSKYALSANTGYCEVIVDGKTIAKSSYTLDSGSTTRALTIASGNFSTGGILPLNSNNSVSAGVFCALGTAYTSGSVSYFTKSGIIFEKSLVVKVLSHSAQATAWAYELYD